MIQKFYCRSFNHFVWYIFWVILLAGYRGVLISYVKTYHQRKVFLPKLIIKIINLNCIKLITGYVKVKKRSIRLRQSFEFLEPQMRSFDMIIKIFLSISIRFSALVLLFTSSWEIFWILNSGRAWVFAIFPITFCLLSFFLTLFFNPPSSLNISTFLIVFCLYPSDSYFEYFFCFAKLKEFKEPCLLNPMLFSFSWLRDIIFEFLFCDKGNLGEFLGFNNIKGNFEDPYAHG